MAKLTRAASLARFILAAAALLLPTLSLLPLGGLYLWEKGYLLWWALAAFGCVLLVSVAQRWLLGTPVDPAIIVDDVSNRPADVVWSPLEEKAWADVRVIAGSAKLDQISDPQTFLDLGLKTIEAVAQRMHPEKSDALWRFTLPEALMISERVSRQLASYVGTNVPFGDRMTLAQFWSIYRWRGGIEIAERAYDVWRLLRFANPATALTHEARDRLSRAIVQWGREHVARRITETFVEEVGLAAIDLYGGRLKLAPIEQTVGDTQAVERPERAASTTTPPICVLVGGGTELACSIVANELQLIQLEQASNPRASMAVDRVSQPSSQEPVTIVSVRSTSTSKPTAKAQSNLIDEIATVDIFLWLISGAKGVEPFDDDVLSAIQTYFAAHPDVHAPVLIPVVILHPNAASTVDPIGAEPQILMNIAQLAKKYGAEPPVTIRMANGTTDVLPLWSNIQAISPRARRVQFIRHIARQKSTNKRPFLPKQVLSAVVALGKSITRRDTSKRPKL